MNTHFRTALTGALLAVLCSSAAQSAMRPDRSLSPLELVQRGFPAIDHPWDVKDYEMALEVLKGLTPEQYPTSASPVSSAVVDRLTDPSALSLCTDPASQLVARLGTCARMIKSVNSIGLLYAQAMAGDKTFSSDAARIIAFTFDAGADVAVMADEILPTLDKNDPDYAKRMAGLEQIKGGIRMMIQGIIEMVDQRDLYPDAARTGLAAALAKDFPRVADDLPQLTRLEFETSLKRIARKDPSPDVRAALASFLSPPGPAPND